MKKLLTLLLRYYANLRRNSKARSLYQMRQRNETLDSFTIREATTADIPQLAKVHAKAWADTYFTVKRPPSYETRLWQWHELFKDKNDSWFCYVAINKEGDIIGFSKGRIHSGAAETGYAGELNKIYLLFEYHRLGLGTKMLQKVAAHFISMNIYNMILFSETSNPTGLFYGKMGAKKLYDEKGKFSGTYAWDDLRTL